METTLDHHNSKQIWNGKTWIKVRLCDNASKNTNSNFGRGIGITPQCFDNEATRHLVINYNEVENVSLDLCPDCAKQLKRNARKEDTKLFKGSVMQTQICEQPKNVTGDNKCRHSRTTILHRQVCKRPLFIIGTTYAVKDMQTGEEEMMSDEEFDFFSQEEIDDQKRKKQERKNLLKLAEDSVNVILMGLKIQKKGGE